MFCALCLVSQCSKCIRESWSSHWCQQKKIQKKLTAQKNGIVVLHPHAGLLLAISTHIFLFCKKTLPFLPFLTHAWPPEWRWCVPTNIKILIPIPFGVLGGCLMCSVGSMEYEINIFMLAIFDHIFVSHNFFFLSYLFFIQHSLFAFTFTTCFFPFQVNWLLAVCYVMGGKNNANLRSLSFKKWKQVQLHNTRAHNSIESRGLSKHILSIINSMWVKI